MTDIQYKCLFKLIIIGNSSTGKSCLLHHYIEGKNSNHTIGVEFGSKIIQQGDDYIKLQIWDTAGQERFKSVARTYYRGSLGALIVYDITSQQSFDNVEQWIKDVKDLARQDISIVVVGNKSDLNSQRVIDKIDASKFCDEQGYLFLKLAFNFQKLVLQKGIMFRNVLIFLLKIQCKKSIQVLNLNLEQLNEKDYVPPNYQNKNLLQQPDKKKSCCYGEQ